MKRDNQFSFVTYEASLKIKPNDPLKVMFDAIDWSFIYSLVKDTYSDAGRGGFDPVSLFKAQLLIYLGEVKSDRKLADSLRFNSRHCVLCGFNNFLLTPTHGVFSQFRKRLGDETFYTILRNLIAQAVVLNVIKGCDLAVDSTHIIAYSNSYGKKSCDCRGRCSCPRTYSDPDAKMGAKRENFFFFGYKAHMLVDKDSSLPIEVTITPGNAGDGPELKPLVAKAKDVHPDLTMKTLCADAAYDAYENYRFLAKDCLINPFISLNDRGKNTGSSNTVLSDEGSYLCPGGHTLVNWGYDKTRNRYKFRCPAILGKANCLFRPTCSSSSYGKTFYLYPDKDLRLIGPIARGTDAWKEKFKGRTAIERTNSELKGQHELNNLRVRALPNVKIHTYLSITAQIVKRIGTVLAAKEKLQPALT